MKIGRSSALLLGIALLVSGCWSRREVNEVTISSALAIDQESEQEIRVTMQVLQPTTTGESGVPRPTVFNVTATGKTTADALRNLNQVLSRRPEWKHNNAIILGEAVARQGVSDALDFFVRDHESRLDQWLLVTHGRAADVLVPRFKLEPNQGVGIRRLNRNAVRLTARTVPIRLYDFMLSLTNPPEAPLAAGVETVQFPDPSNEERLTQRLRIAGTAVFRQDRLAGWLDESESRGLQWLRGHITGPMLVVPCRKGPGQGIGVEVMRVRAKLRAQWQGTLPTVRVMVNVSAKLGDLMCPEDLSQRQAQHDLQYRTAALIEAEIENVLERLQHDLVADPVGIATAIERRFPAQWKQLRPRWDEVFPKIKVKPEVAVELEQTGITVGKPLPGGSGAR